jgi:hypothetical protein
VFPILERAGHPQAGAFFFLRIVTFGYRSPAIEKTKRFTREPTGRSRVGTANGVIPP